MSADDEGHVAGALYNAAMAVTSEQCAERLNEAIRRGLSPDVAAGLLKSWVAINAPQVIGADRG